MAGHGRWTNWLLVTNVVGDPYLIIDAHLVFDTGVDYLRGR